MLELRKDIFADERDDNLNEIGKGTQRQDMLGHVTGTSSYFNDHKLQGMLHLKVVRSTQAHARLRHIDTTPDSAMRGLIRGHRLLLLPVPEDEHTRRIPAWFAASPTPFASCISRPIRSTSR